MSGQLVRVTDTLFIMTVLYSASALQYNASDIIVDCQQVKEPCNRQKNRTDVYCLNGDRICNCENSMMDRSTYCGCNPQFFSNKPTTLNSKHKGDPGDEHMIFPIIWDDRVLEDGNLRRRGLVDDGKCTENCSELTLYSGDSCCLGDCFKTTDCLWFWMPDNRTCVKSCPDGFYIRDNYCMRQCPLDYYISDNRCLYACPIDSYIFENHCVQRCPFYTVDDKRCFRNCPVGYYPDYPKCKKCNKACDAKFKCTGPTSSDCDQCVSGVVFESDTNPKGRGNCILECPADMPFRYPLIYTSLIPRAKTLCRKSCDRSFYLHEIVRELTVLGDYNCISSCPDTHPYFDHKTCVTRCPEGFFITKESKLCHKECRDGMFHNPGDHICLHKCDHPYPFVWQKKCLERCPEYAPFYWEFQCGTTCPGHFVHVPNQCRCRRDCPLEYPYRMNDRCLSKCPHGTNRMSTSCVSECPYGRYGHRGMCLKQCPPKTFIYRRTCVHFCPIGSSLLKQNSTCLGRCPYGTYNESGQCRNCSKVCEGCHGHLDSDCDACAFASVKKDLHTVIKCVEACPVDQIYLVPEVISTKPSAKYHCTSNCSLTGHAYHIKGQTQCILGCPTGYVVLDETHACIRKCPESKPFVLDANAACVESCPQDWYVWHNTHHKSGKISCVEQCPPGTLRQSTNGTNDCVYSCRQNKPYLYQNTCIKTCPEDVRLFETDSVTFICTNNITCLNDEETLVNINDTFKCRSACPNRGMFLYHYTCINACPRGTHYNQRPSEDNLVLCYPNENKLQLIILGISLALTLFYSIYRYGEYINISKSRTPHVSVEEAKNILLSFKGIVDQNDVNDTGADNPYCVAEEERTSDRAALVKYTRSRIV